MFNCLFNWLLLNKMKIYDMILYYKITCESVTIWDRVSHCLFFINWIFFFVVKKSKKFFSFFLFRFSQFFPQFSRNFSHKFYRSFSDILTLFFFSSKIDLQNTKKCSKKVRKMKDILFLKIEITIFSNEKKSRKKFVLCQ